jgi:hypothetical protein
LPRLPLLYSVTVTVNTSGGMSSKHRQTQKKLIIFGSGSYFQPDNLAGYTANPKAGYRISGKIFSSKFKGLIKYEIPVNKGTKFQDILPF